MRITIDYVPHIEPMDEISTTDPVAHREMRVGSLLRMGNSDDNLSQFEDVLMPEIYPIALHGANHEEQNSIAAVANEGNTAPFPNQSRSKRRNLLLLSITIRSLSTLSLVFFT
jgi:hypothetical protein